MSKCSGKDLGHLGHALKSGHLSGTDPGQTPDKRPSWKPDWLRGLHEGGDSAPDAAQPHTPDTAARVADDSSVFSSHKGRGGPGAEPPAGPGAGPPAAAAGPAAPRKAASLAAAALRLLRELTAALGRRPPPGPGWYGAQARALLALIDGAALCEATDPEGRDALLKERPLSEADLDGLAGALGPFVACGRDLVRFATRKGCFISELQRLESRS